MWDPSVTVSCPAELANPLEVLQFRCRKGHDHFAVPLEFAGRFFAVDARELRFELLQNEDHLQAVLAVERDDRQQVGNAQVPHFIKEINDPLPRPISHQRFGRRGDRQVNELGLALEPLRGDDHKDDRRLAL